MIDVLTLIGILLGIVTALLLMFLPAIIELKNPRDPGPRLIAENFMMPVPPAPPVLLNIEGESMIIMTYARFLRFLPNLESAFPEQQPGVSPLIQC